MLLVKQNVLKNYASLTAIFLGLLTTVGEASAKQVTPVSVPSILNLLLSLAAVLGLIFVLAFFAKKMRFGPANQQGIKLVANLTIGTKERVVVVEVENEQYLLGVTSSQINLLQKLPHNISKNDHSVLPGQLSFDLASVLKKGKS